MNLRVQRLHAAVETLWESGDVLHGCHCDASIGYELCGGAGGDDLDTRGGELGSDLGGPCLVIDADERPPDGLDFGHGCASRSFDG